MFIGLTSIFYGLLTWDKTGSIRDFLNQILPLDLRRFYWIHPVCWTLLFTLSLYYIQKEIKWGKYIVIASLLVQLGYVTANQPYFINKGLPSYKEFYAEKQFEDIKTYIGKDQSSYRIISLWLHPAVSQYNGFYTLDGFITNYPLSYKYEFRKIIAKELDKRESIKRDFDDWGSKCYAYVAEYGLNYLWYDNNLSQIQHLDYNYDALKEMGGQYIISAAEINTVNNPRLKLLKIFDNYPTSHWTIYLYEVL